MEKNFDTVQWLKAALKHSGMTHQELSDAIGGIISRTGISKAANYPKAGEKPRNLKADELLAISKATRYKLPHDEENKDKVNEYKPHTVPVRGIISPGTWREAGLLMNMDYVVSAVADPKLARLQQYALRLEDLRNPAGRFQYGDFLVFVELAPNAANVEDDDILHVERHERGRTETTIRTVHILPDGRYELTLYGGSDDAPAVLESLLDTSVMEVKGVFIGAWSPKRR